jgi:hypothetical protein
MAVLAGFKCGRGATVFRFNRIMPKKHNRQLLATPDVTAFPVFR